MFIYKITNLVNQKVYIGQTIQINPRMRWYSHQADARKGKKSYLYDSMRKHGINNFTWEVIDQCSNIDELNLLEKKWLSHYRSIVEVYNNREAGNNKIHSATSIEKMKESQKQAHTRRRIEGRNTHKEHKKHIWTVEHPKKGKSSTKWSAEARERYKIIAKEREAKKRLAKGN